jgi:hypothetical protein
MVATVWHELWVNCPGKPHGRHVQIGYSGSKLNDLTSFRVAGGDSVAEFALDRNRFNWRSDKRPSAIVTVLSRGIRMILEEGLDGVVKERIQHIGEPLYASPISLSYKKILAEESEEEKCRWFDKVLKVLTAV